MTRARWERLADDIAASALIEADTVTINATPYAQSVRGRVEHGTSYSIDIRLPGAGLVHIADEFWAKNPTWVGWRVTAEDAEGIIITRFAVTKLTGETVEYIAGAIRMTREHARRVANGTAQR